MPVAQEEVSTAGPSTQPSGAQLPPPSSASEAEAEGDSESESHSPDATRVLQLVDRKRILRACDVSSPLHSYTALADASSAGNDGSNATRSYSRTRPSHASYVASLDITVPSPRP